MEIGEFPIVTFRCNDGSQLSLDCPFLWQTGIQDKVYQLVYHKDGICELNDSYYFDFIKKHSKGVRYTGLVVSDDDDNYYVEVDDYCGVVEKQWNRKKGIELDAEYPVEVIWYDKTRRIVKFKFV